MPNDALPFKVKKKLIRFNEEDLDYLEHKTKNSSHFIRVLVSKIVVKMKERDNDGEKFDWEL